MTRRDRDHVIDSGFPLASSEGWWTRDRVALYRWFGRTASHLAPLYLAGLRLVFEESFPGRVHLVAHAMREIRNRLPHAIAGEIKPGPKYEDVAAAVHMQWAKDAVRFGGVSALGDRSEPSAFGPEGYQVSRELMRAVKNVVDCYEASKGSAARKAELLFETVGGAPPPAYVVRAWYKSGWSEWADRYMHVGNNPHPPMAHGEVGPTFEQFEAALIALSTRPLVHLEVLDDILESANSS